jgi:integral membrane protein
MKILNVITFNPLRRLRIIGFLEGISYLILLGIAMPLKYYAGFPMAVKITGWAHGLLFILYIYAVIQAYYEYNWSIRKTFIALVASILPFGPFLLEAGLKKEELELKEVK